MKQHSTLDSERGLVVVADESGHEIATISVPCFATPVSLGARLKKIGGHFYFPPMWSETNTKKIDGAIWASSMDFAAWLTGYLKFGGTRRARLANRTRFFFPSSIELLPTGTRPRGVVYTYVLRPMPSRTKSGVHVHLAVFAMREGRDQLIFEGNLHKFDALVVNQRGYEYLELGRAIDYRPSRTE